MTVAKLGAVRAGQRLRRPAAEPAAQALQDRADEVALGKLLFQALSQLRGTALKVSQLLSMDTAVLPEGVRAELAQACHQVMPLNRALIGRVFRQSFGQEPEQMFSHFEPVAFAAASLGQVHRAEISGLGPVAVKVQYPGIAATVPSDMRLLRATLKALGHGVVVLPDSTVVDRLLSEIEAALMQELDYEREAQQLLWFAKHAAWPGVVIPRPVLTHSSRHVLTQELLNGVHLDAWLAQQPSQQERNQFGQRLFDWFMHCAFELGQLQADLHPGNFLFLSNGRLGVLDFGYTCAMSAGFRQNLAKAWTCAQDLPTEAQGLLASYQSMGFLKAELSLPAFQAEVLPSHTLLLDWQTEIFKSPVFDCKHKSVLPRPSKSMQKALNQYMHRVPAEMPAFDRAWLGLMHMLTRMGAQIRTSNRWIKSSG